MLSVTPNHSSFQLSHKSTCKWISQWLKSMFKTLLPCKTEWTWTAAYLIFNLLKFI